MSFRLASLSLVLACTACSHPQPLPDLGVVPPFTLTDQAGQPFQRATLRDHVWIVDFIYTNCPGPCPLMSQRMNRIQSRTASQPSIRLISFSVDPARDTPAALREYARRFSASPERWTFLTGDRDMLQMLDHDTFKLGSLDSAFEHSTRFVLMDRNAHIRGYYSFGEQDMVTRIVQDALALVEEKR